MTYSVRHGTAPAPLQQHIEGQVSGLTRFNERLVQADIILDHDGHRHIAELRLQTSTDTHFARSEAADWRSAMDITVDKLRRQLTRDKEKRLRRTPLDEPGGYQGGEE
ncbi:MAG: HPF/RaiA family ribosome-associated protein [Gemmatimonadota bacterium]